MKQYSVAQLKRDARDGVIFGIMTMRAGKRISQDALPERLRGSRKLIGSNSVSLAFENKTDPSKPSCVWLPKASLIEYTDTYLRIYSPGYREPNEAEQKVLDQWRDIEHTERYQKQLETDCLTDGFSSYYQKLSFFRKHDMEYLMGAIKQRGLILDWNKRNAGEKAFIQDENIKGKISLEYQIERTRSLEPISLNDKIRFAVENLQVCSDMDIEKYEPVR